MTLFNGFLIKNSLSKGYYGYRNQRLDYYKQHNRASSNKALSNIFSNLHKLDTQFDVKNQIRPHNIEMGSYYYEVIHELGKPRFEISSKIGKNHKVSFYRKKIGGYNFLTQLHFYKNQLVYAKLDFEYLTYGVSCRNTILNSLFEKYSINQDISIRNDVLLKDFDNNTLKISDSGKITLEYFCGDNNLINNILDMQVNIVTKPNMLYFAQELIHNVI